jgi:hypothetical protein
MTENNEQFSNLSPNTQPHSGGLEPTISMKYYDLKKNWHRVRPHLADKELNDILVRDFNKFTFGRWGREFVHGDLPREFESCHWDWEHRGRRPAFWQYVKHTIRRYGTATPLCLISTSRHSELTPMSVSIRRSMRN